MALSDEKMHVCFVSMEAYATLQPGLAEHAGGAGFQVVQLARGLRDAGHRVSFVVGDYGQPFQVEIEGFQVYRSNKVAYDKSVTRALQNLLRLFKAMRAAGADYYVLRSTRYLAFFVMFFARLLGARYVFMIANISHCVKEELESLSPVFRRLYAISLRFAHGVTAQFKDQAAMMLENFNIRASVVPNCFNVPEQPEPMPEAQWDAAWIATVKASKRPDRLIHIAESAPDLKFVVAGGPGHDQAYFDDTTAKLKALPNVDYVGFVQPDQVDQYYAKSRVYLMTSDLEGFPNTFLYAWSKGRPVVSTGVDPDGLLAKRGLGAMEPDLDKTAEVIRGLINCSVSYAESSDRCRAYVSEAHTVDIAITLFIKALKASR
jgi:glycosyltransferase involved in cell wall biosynthesis